jgi:hypothetical protein
MATFEIRKADNNQYLGTEPAETAKDAFWLFLSLHWKNVDRNSLEIEPAGDDTFRGSYKGTEYILKPAPKA